MGSQDVYLASERTARNKHECWRGHVYPMETASFTHNVIVGNVARLFGELVVDRPDIVLASAMKVHIPAVAGYVYPDLSIVGDAVVFVDDERDVIGNPKIIVEVASDSSECFDRGEKFAGYRTLDSVIEFVLIAESRVRVEHYTRTEDGDWELREYGAGSRIAIDRLDGEIDVDEIYRKAR